MVIFGKFVNKNAVKSVFKVVLVEVSQKSRKMLIFWKKIFLTTAKIWDTSTKVQSPPTQISPRKGSKFRSHIMDPSWKI